MLASMTVLDSFFIILIQVMEKMYETEATSQTKTKIKKIKMFDALVSQQKRASYAKQIKISIVRSKPGRHYKVFVTSITACTRLLREK